MLGVGPSVNSKLSMTAKVAPIKPKSIPNISASNELTDPIPSTSRSSYYVTNNNNHTDSNINNNNSCKPDETAENKKNENSEKRKREEKLKLKAEKEARKVSIVRSALNAISMSKIRKKQ